MTSLECYYFITHLRNCVIGGTSMFAIINCFVENKMLTLMHLYIKRMSTSLHFSRIIYIIIILPFFVRIKSETNVKSQYSNWYEIADFVFLILICPRNFGTIFILWIWYSLPAEKIQGESTKNIYIRPLPQSIAVILHLSIFYNTNVHVWGFIIHFCYMYTASLLIMSFINVWACCLQNIRGI